jgi:hypothetical protein
MAIIASAFAAKFYHQPNMWNGLWALASLAALGVTIREADKSK